MGVRETLSKSKPLGIGLGSLMILVGVVAIYVQAGGGGTNAVGQFYITDDDGKTFTRGSNKVLTTLGKDGKPVARAHVFECGGKRIVGYMSRYTDEAMKVLVEARSAVADGKPPPDVSRLSAIPLTGMEFKRPGDAKWVLSGDTAGMARMREYQCPDGNRPEEVLP